MKRIHIFGGPGSGKSTLARRLASENNLPLVELDSLFWDNDSPGYGVRRDPAERDKLLTEQVKDDTWIIEGVYWSWCLPSFERAEQIIILNTPHWIRQWRAGLRFFKRMTGIERSLKKDSLKGYLELVQWNAKWNRNNLAKAIEILKPFEAKIKYM